LEGIIFLKNIEHSARHLHGANNMRKATKRISDAVRVEIGETGAGESILEDGPDRRGIAPMPA
jgi:hypothetical protein